MAVQTKQREEENSPPSCVSRAVLHLASLCWQPRPLHVPKKKNYMEKWREKLNLCYSLLKGISRASLPFFLSPHLCSVLIFHLQLPGLSTPQLLLPPLCSPSHLFISSPSSLPLCPPHHPSALRVFITALSGSHQLPREPLIETVAQNE